MPPVDDADSSRIKLKSDEPKIAFVTVSAFSRCQDKARPEFKYALDGPAVLAASIHRHYPNSTLLVLAHPTTKKCGIEKLQAFGCRVVYKDLPVAIEDIQNSDYVRLAKYDRSGCCGLREFLKLYCFNMTDYDLVIHLDLDMLLKESLHDLIRVMMGKAPEKPVSTVRSTPIPKNGVDFVYTRDYKGGKEALHPRDPSRVGVQGGFFMVRPNRTVFQNMLNIIRKGNFSLKRGWEGSGVGGFYGDVRIQGFLSYYYYRYPERSLEVDRCIYNTVMEDDYLHEDDGTCLTNETTCRDCRRAQWEDLVLLHYTMCTKPWTCQLPRFRKGDWHLCKRAHQEWFRLRYELEHPGVTITHKASTALNNTYGYCSEYGFFDQRKDAYTSGLVDAG